MKEPTPINNDTLPTNRDDAVQCWRFNASRAMGRPCMNYPVEKVWATRFVLYTRDPSGDEYISGSRSIGVLYETEADAWEACYIAVKNITDKRLAEIRDMAAKIRKQQEQPND